MLDTVAFGDMNDDGWSMLSSCWWKMGGSGEFESVAVVLNTNGAPSQAGQALLGDRVQVRQMTITSGVLALDMLVQGQRSDVLSIPARITNYRMVGNAFWLTKPGYDHPAGTETRHYHQYTHGRHKCNQPVYHQRR